MSKKSVTMNIFGYTGAVLVIIGFALLSLNKVGPHDASYLLLNLFGGLGILTDAFYHKDYPSGFLNIVFSAIAFISLIAILF